MNKTLIKRNNIWIMTRQLPLSFLALLTQLRTSRNSTFYLRHTLYFQKKTSLTLVSFWCFKVLLTADNCSQINNLWWIFFINRSFTLNSILWLFWFSASSSKTMWVTTYLRSFSYNFKAGLRKDLERENFHLFWR